MVENTYNIKLNTQGETIGNKPIEVYQNDHISFMVKLFNDDEIINGINYTYTLISVLQDGEKIIRSGTINDIGFPIFKLGSDEMRLIGNVNAYVQAFDELGNRITSYEFSYTVKEDVSTDGVVKPVGGERLILVGENLLKQSILKSNISIKQSTDALQNSQKALSDSNEALTNSNASLNNSQIALSNSEKAVVDSTDALVNSDTSLMYSKQSLVNSQTALENSEQAVTTSNSVQEQFNQVVINGDSSVESAQARVNADGSVTYTTLKDRLDTEHNRLTAQLAHTSTKAETFSNITTPKSITISANNNRIPFISFVDDDGFIEFFNLMAPKLESKGFVGTAAIITGNVGKPGYMTIEQLRDLQSRGFELASHLHEDSKYVSTKYNTIEEIDYQCRHSKELLNSWGIKADHLVYPGGVRNAEGKRIAKQYYKAGYNANTVNNDTQNGLITDAFEIARISGDTGDYEQIKSQIDRCIQEKNWLIIMTHVKTHTQEKLDALFQVIDYVATLDVGVGTLDQGFELFGPRLDVGYDRYIKVLGDGDIYSNVIGSVFKNPFDGYEINENTPLSYFEKEKITYSSFRVEDGGTFPVKNSGLLETYASAKNISLSYQIWKPYGTERVFKRYWSGTYVEGTWREWQEQVYKKTTSFIIPSTNLLPNESKTVSIDLTGFLGNSVATDRQPYTLTYRESIVDGIMWTSRIERGILKINFYNPLDVSRNMYANDWDLTILV